MPGATGCVDSTPRSCSATGSWLNGSACSGALPRCLPDTGSCGPDEWALQFDDLSITSVAVDSAGNSFVAGSSGTDSVARKFDAAGTARWTVSFDEGYSGINSAELDGSGNLVVVATTQELISFDFVGTPYLGLLARKYSGSTGTELWRAEYTQSNYSSRLTVDGSDRVLVGAYTSSFVLLRLGPDGSELSTREIAIDDGTGTVLSFEPESMTTDAAGNLLMAGGTYDPFSGETQAFVCKFAQDGSELWTRLFGTVQNDRAYSVAVDGAGNVYVTGTTSGVLTGPATTSLANAFLRKYDPNGTVLWTQQFNDASTADQYTVAVDGAGNVYLAGQTPRALNGQAALGGLDLFLMKFSGAGTLLATRQFGTAADDEIQGGVAVTAAGTAFVGCLTEGTLPGQSLTGASDSCLFKLQL